jgi:sodium/potassium-transporting ATPase subunit alpha
MLFQTKFMLTLSEANPPTESEGPLPAPLASWDSFAPGDLLLCVKGAPEILLGRCSHVISSSADQPLFLTYAARQRIVAIQEQWAAQGRRVLLLARRVVPRDVLSSEIDPYSEEFSALVDSLNSDLIIVGMVGLIDPLKPDIRDTVRCALSPFHMNRVLMIYLWLLPPSGYVVVLESASSSSLETTPPPLSP